MDDVTRHPEDDVLFDLVDGALDPARADVVRRHLARCAACAAFVEAATAGAAAAQELVEEMPDDLDSQLHAAVRGAWRERRAAIAAGEAAADAGDATVVVDAPAVAGSTAPAPAPRARRVRRWIPVVAFAMLATLAGASLYVGDDRIAPERGASGEADSAVQDEAGIDAGATSVTGDPGAPIASDDPAGSAAGPVPEANEISGGSGDDLADAARDAATAPEGGGDAAFEVPPVGLEDDDVLADGGEAGKSGADSTIDDADVAATETETESDLRCFATLDETALVLPDGRLAVQVLRGPLGIFVVCG